VTGGNRGRGGGDGKTVGENRGRKGREMINLSSEYVR
jgi:hypothetical protein